jgi:hypothetical protein
MRISKTATVFALFLVFALFTTTQVEAKFSLRATIEKVKDHIKPLVNVAIED